MTSIRRVFFTSVMTAVTQIIATGFGVVRLPWIARPISKEVGFFYAASWKTADFLESLWAA
jgi:hypothetical protein